MEQQNEKCSNQTDKAFVAVGLRKKKQFALSRHKASRSVWSLVEERELMLLTKSILSMRSTYVKTLGQRTEPPCFVTEIFSINIVTTKHRQFTNEQSQQEACNATFFLFQIAPI